MKRIPAFCADVARAVTGIPTTPKMYFTPKRANERAASSWPWIVEGAEINKKKVLSFVL